MEENKYKQVYKSTRDTPFEVWFAPQEVKVEYPFTEVVPDSSLKAPIFIWKTQSWAENDQVSQASQLNELKNTLGDLKESNEEKAEQVDKLTTNLTAISENQAKMLKMMAPLLAKGGTTNA